MRPADIYRIFLCQAESSNGWGEHTAPTVTVMAASPLVTSEG